MPKIKRKVEMTLPKLIEWAWENEVSDKAFYSNLDGGSVYFDKIQNLSIEHEIAINETFTVEIEEEITEDTVIFRLLEVRNAIPSKKTEWQDLKLLKSYLYGNHSISEVKNEHSVAIYILNDDMTMTLIWKDGAMVDD
ncbi:hypothetical protein CWR44_09545 [Staphylococcus haemolyticus]|uniref:hypothetical protein n=1 Tax=Staphylococcus haemolyticus TaxID=1283 RepID=UPI000CEB451E|nr:hypothetical protein [Staphylococcus haemolyticus]AVH47439.1 hypothetical protein CWR44_09545 [Staphylococcus haemolyticus]